MINVVIISLNIYHRNHIPYSFFQTTKEGFDASCSVDPESNEHDSIMSRFAPRVGDSHGQLERVIARESGRELKRRKRAPSLEEATPKEAVASPPAPPP